MPPLASSNLQGQDFEYKFAVLQGYWRWKTRMDVSQATPQYSVRDVVSPFGLLRDNVPIPGPVVVAMAASITELQSTVCPAHPRVADHDHVHGRSGARLRTSGAPHGHQQRRVRLAALAYAHVERPLPYGHSGGLGGSPVERFGHNPSLRWTRPTFSRSVAPTRPR